MCILRINDISFLIKNKPILGNINFNINQKDKVVIVGHNGSGKSMLLEVILNNIKPTTGTVNLSKNIKRIGVVYDTFFLSLS